MEFTIIIPMMNEQENVHNIYREILNHLEPLSRNFEIIFVDDGSTDESVARVEQLTREDSRVKMLCFSRNFGHQAALTAGLEISQGQAIISMDADHQHPPSLIPAMVKEWREGYKIVIAVRESTADISWFKKITSALFYRIFSRLADVELSANAADYRLLDREVVNVLCDLPERVRFLRGLTSWVGFKATEITYRAGRRESGTTKYSLRKMFSLAVDGITSFSTKPLWLSAYLGLIATSLSLLYAIYTFYVHFFTTAAVPGWTSMILVVLFMGGLQLLSNGLLGIYLGKTYEEVKGRPVYIVAKKYGFEKENR